MTPQEIQASVITTLIVVGVGAVATWLGVAFRRVMSFPTIYATKLELAETRREIRTELKAMQDARAEDLAIMRAALERIDEKLDHMHETMVEVALIGANLKRVEETVGGTNGGIVLELHQVKNKLAVLVPGFSEVR